MSGAETGDTEPRHLFVGGCPRTGTTAMVRLLNAHPRIIVGRERFKKVLADIGPEHFAPEHFFRPTATEATYRDEEFYAELERRWAKGSVRYIGDKVPRYDRWLPTLREKFPTCKIVLLLRELEPVASSYNLRARNPDDHGWPDERDYRYAVRDWNQSLELLARYAERHGDDHVFPVIYERLYAGDRDCLEALFGFLELPPGPAVRRRFRSMTQRWEERAAKPLALDPEERAHVDSHRDERSRERAWELAARAVERWRPDPDE